MKKCKKLKFDDVIDTYVELFPNGKWVRTAPVLKADTPAVVAEGIREAIRLSEQLIWKRHSRK